jgi:hypothetical protein
VISAVITLAGALVVLAWMPGRRAVSAQEAAPAAEVSAEQELAVSTEG